MQECLDGGVIFSWYTFCEKTGYLWCFNLLTAPHLCLPSPCPWCMSAWRIFLFDMCGLVLSLASDYGFPIRGECSFSFVQVVSLFRVPLSINYFASWIVCIYSAAGSAVWFFALDLLFGFCGCLTGGPSPNFIINMSKWLYSDRHL